MSRIRTVKPELFKHEDLFDAEQNSKLPLRLAFIGLFTVADREGRFKWRPRTLKLDVLPHDLINFADVLDALEHAGFIERYEADGESYGWIPTFGKHQRFSGKEAEVKSQLPPPPQRGSNGEATGKHPDTSQTLHREATGKQQGTQEWNKEGEQEGKGKEEERAHAETAPKDTPPAPTLKGSRLSLEVLPSDWQAWAERERPDLDPQRTFNAFHDYWIGKPGADSMKLDWFATWRNWVRREHAQTKNTTPRNGTPASQLSRQGQQQVSSIEAWLQRPTTIEAEVISSELN